SHLGEILRNQRLSIWIHLTRREPGSRGKKDLLAGSGRPALLSMPVSIRSVPEGYYCSGRKDKMALRQIKRTLQMLFEFASVQINYPVIFLLLVSLCFLPSHFIYLTFVI